MFHSSAILLLIYVGGVDAEISDGKVTTLCGCFVTEIVKACFSAVSPRFVRFARSEQSVIVGDILKLSCNAVGKPKPYIHWFKDGKLIKSFQEATRESATPLLTAEKDDNGYKPFDKEHIKIVAYTLKINKVSVTVAAFILSIQFFCR